MKRLLFLVAFITLAMSSMAQGNVDADRVNIRKNFTMPFLDTIAAAIKIGEERTRPQDSLVWYWQGLRWVNLRGVVSVKDTIPLFHIGLGSPALRPIYAINGALRASNWGAGYGWVPRLLTDSTMVGDVDTTSIAYKQWVINQFGPGGPLTVGFQNALNLAGSNAELGGNLLHSTTITSNTFPLIISGSVNGTTLSLINNNAGVVYGLNSTTTDASSTAIVGVGGNIGVAGQSVNGIGLVGTSTNGFGAQITSNGNAAADFQAFRAATNTITSITTYEKFTTGTAANGLGGSLDVNIQTSTGSGRLSNQMVSKWIDVTDATRTSQWLLNGVTNAITSTWMDINGTTANFYGTGSSITAISGQLGATLTGSVTGVLASGPIPFWGVNTSTVTNSIVDGLLIQRGGAYNGAAGVGLQIRLEHKNSTGGIVTAGIISNKFTTATAGSEVSQWDFSVNNGGAGQITKFSIGGAATFLTATRFQTAAGVVVASANNLTLGGDGNMFHISGTTQINAITTLNWQAGSEFTLIFDGSLTVKNNTAGGGGTAVMKLAGAADFAATADDELTLTYDGIIFREKSRSVN